MKNLFNFDKLVGLSAFFIAGCAAYFSILGIGMLFGGSNIAAMVMASSLEIGKLVSTSFLYRYWKETKTFLKIYLSIAIITLIFITSLGIFGFLSSAYQTSAIESKIVDGKISIIEDQRKYSDDKIVQAKSRIENIMSLRNSQEQRLNESMTNILISRNPIQLAEIQQQTEDAIISSDKKFEIETSKIQKAITELQEFDSQITTLRTELSGKKDILTFKFVAELFGLELNIVVKWFIVLLIAVFDPLAICLLLAYNTATFKLPNNYKTLEDTKNLPISTRQIDDSVSINIPTETNNDIVSPKKTKSGSKMRGFFSF